MRTLSIQYPESLPDAAHMSDSDFQEEAKMAMAVKRFELGKLTSGQVARLVNIPRAVFLQSLSKFGIPAIDWEAEEITQELENA